MSAFRPRPLRALPVALACALVACEPPPGNDAERLALSYAAASAEFDVPRPLLEAIGYVETRWWMRPGVPALDDGYGTMHLVDRGDGSPLRHAAQLLALPDDALRTDRDANIRGAAALLRARADRYFADGPHKDPADLAAWWQVVMHYSNAVDPEVADGYATQVFQTIGRGARAVLEDGSVHAIPARVIEVESEKLFGQMQHPLTPDYASAVTYKQARRYSEGRGKPIDTVVVHTVQGSYASCISWFQHQDVQSSAHYVVRSSDGEITQMVRNGDTAWHAGNWDVNQRSVGIEHEGFVDQPQWLTDALYRSSANLTRWLADSFAIPKTRAHVIGHNEVPHPSTPGRFGGISGHTDPCVTIDGRQCFWDWDRYMSLVGGGAAPERGFIRGRVYSSEGGCRYDGQTFVGCSKAVVGARVYVPETGAAVLTNGSGDFVIELPPGTYTPSGSAPGYADSVPVLGTRREVTAGGTTWSSFILQKLPDTGTVRGFVYAVNPLDPADRSRRVDGALVGVGSTVVSADEQGRFELVVGVGEVTVEAQKQGHASASQTVVVQKDGEVTVELGLVPHAPPRITLTAPAVGANIRTAHVRVTGRVQPAEVERVLVNGMHATLAGNGSFVASVPIELGENLVRVVAWSLEGLEGSAEVRVSRVEPPTEEPPAEEPEGCGCTSGGDLAAVALTGLGLLARRRRRAR